MDILQRSMMLIYWEVYLNTGISDLVWSQKVAFLKKFSFEVVLFWSVCKMWTRKNLKQNDFLISLVITDWYFIYLFHISGACVLHLPRLAKNVSQQWILQKNLEGKEGKVLYLNLFRLCSIDYFRNPALYIYTNW